MMNNAIRKVIRMGIVSALLFTVGELQADEQPRGNIRLTCIDGYKFAVLVKPSEKWNYDVIEHISPILNEQGGGVRCELTQPNNEPTYNPHEKTGMPKSDTQDCCSINKWTSGK